jgi:chemotaxis protein MotA
MKIFIGLAVVIGCVILGYVLNGGHLGVLWQPFEFLIILGAGIGAYVIANPGAILQNTGKNLSRACLGPKYEKKDYLQLLCLLFYIFKMAKTKGMLVIESHIENPSESAIFQRFPSFLKNHEALAFTCDYLRLLIMGTDNVYQLDDLMSDELDLLAHDDHANISAFEKMADGMPALGIVAAVLGVIHTMGSISQPAEVLGHLIGGALVGTFFGVLVSYGIIGPIAQALKASLDADQNYIKCIRAAFISYLNGSPPIIIVEFARKALEEHQRPSFEELETATQQLSDI